jgi:hypothetical protein
VCHWTREVLYNFFLSVQSVTDCCPDPDDPVTQIGGAKYLCESTAGANSFAKDRFILRYTRKLFLPLMCHCTTIFR